MHDAIKILDDLTKIMYANPEEETINLLETELSLSISRQKIMLYLDVHRMIINLIRDGTFHLKKVYEDRDSQIEFRELLFQVFKKAHFFLEKFCLHNENNQNILSPFIPLFLKNIYINIGQIPLICSITLDNRIVCEEFADIIIQAMNEAILKEGRRTIYLEPLIV